jgi:ssDNA-specific exonuclease RecJ
MQKYGDKPELENLYKTLIQKKYLPVREETKRTAAKHLEKQVRRAVRDDPRLLKEIG